jgi:hypothetical protein
MIEQSAASLREFHQLRVEPSYGASFGGGQFKIARHQQFCGRDSFKLCRRVQAIKLSHSEFARRNIGVCDARRALSENNACQIIIRAPFQQTRLDDCAGRDDANDFAFDKPFARRRDLIANGDFVPAIDEFRQMAFERANGNARKRVRVSFAEPFARENYPKLASYGLRVFVKGFIEIADLKKQYHARISALDLKVLAAKRRGHI